MSTEEDHTVLRRVKSIPTDTQDLNEWDFVNAEKERQSPQWLSDSMWDSVDVVRKLKPRIQCCTNFVSMEVVESGLLAMGCDCVHTHEPLDPLFFFNTHTAIHCNIGTLTHLSLLGITEAVSHAREHGVKWILDPIAVTITDWRVDAVMDLLELHPDAITMNATETKMLAIMCNCCDNSILRDSTPSAVLTAARKVSIKLNAVVVTLDSDVGIVTDGVTSLHIRGAAQLAFAMKTVGAGRTLISSIITSFVACRPNNILLACAHAVSFLTVCFETISKRSRKPLWCSRLRTAMIDEIYSSSKKTALAKPKIRDMHWTTQDNSQGVTGCAEQLNELVAN